MALQRLLLACHQGRTLREEPILSARSRVARLILLLSCSQVVLLSSRFYPMPKPAIVCRPQCGLYSFQEGSARSFRQGQPSSYLECECFFHGMVGKESDYLLTCELLLLVEIELYRGLESDGV